MKTVASILSQKGPHFNIVSPETKVINALAIMKAENFSYLIVKNKDSFAGLFSERDYAQKVVLMGRSSSTTSIGEIMSENLPVVAKQDSADHCMYLMNSFKTRYLPVFDNFDFKGVVTINDLLRLSISKTATEVTESAI